MAAQYAFAIACNQVFFDGNKRTALVVCRTFLLLNGYDVVDSQAGKYETMMNLVRGTINRDQMAEWIRAHWKPVMEL